MKLRSAVGLIALAGIPVAYAFQSTIDPVQRRHILHTQTVCKLLPKCPAATSFSKRGLTVALSSIP